MTEKTEECKCMFCEKVFASGDKIQAFLRSPDDPVGHWTDSVVVDDKFQERHQRNQDKIKRRCVGCGPDSLRSYECVRCGEWLDQRDDNFVCENSGTAYHPEFGEYHWWEGEITCDNCELKQPYGDQSV